MDKPPGDTKKYFYPLPIPLPEDAVTVEIPSWSQASDTVRLRADRCTPLDLFIAHHEPAGMDGLQFRNELQVLLDYVFYCGSKS